MILTVVAEYIGCEEATYKDDKGEEQVTYRVGLLQGMDAVKLKLDSRETYEYFKTVPRLTMMEFRLTPRAFINVAKNGAADISYRLEGFEPVNADVKSSGKATK